MTVVLTLTLPAGVIVVFVQMRTILPDFVRVEYVESTSRKAIRYLPGSFPLRILVLLEKRGGEALDKHL